MKSGADYLLGQLLSLAFYVMTLIIYNRARREYVGGKIADAINLIIIFLAILLVTDTADYFLGVFLPVGNDIELIVKILLKLLALSVLFFGGLRFFSKRTVAVYRDTGMGATDPGIARFSPPSAERTAPGHVGTQPPPAAKPTLGRYEIIEQIGKGAMGIVYKGRDPKLQRLTAIKTIRFIDDYDEEKVEKVKSHFYHEAEVVARLSHRNIVKIYDVGEDLDLSYLAMEFLEGASLEHAFQHKSPLPIVQTLDIIIQVCDALDYAHARGIIHRDIKPGNIMVLKNGDVKVTDFGIARAAGSTKTRTGIIKGTPYYMSPEQARGMTLDGSADIFSLGVVLYQVLTGKLPFTGENLAAIMYQTANVDPESPAAHNPDIGQSLVDVIMRALAKKPEARYRTAGQMANDLRRVKDRLEAQTRGRDVPARQPGSESQAEERSLAGQGAASRETQFPSNGREASPRDDLDFSDLDRVLSTDFEKTREKTPDGTVVLHGDGRDQGQQPWDTVVTARIDRPVSAADGRDAGTAIVRRPEAPDAPSYQVVKTITDSRRDGNDTGRTHRGAGPGRNGVRNMLAALVRRRTLVFVIAGLMLAGGLGGAYLFFQQKRTTDSQNEIQEQQRALFQQIMKEKMLEKQRLASEETQQQSISSEQEKEKLETQQEQQRIVQQKFEEARKKQEAERRARIEAEEREKQAQLERERLAQEREKQRQAEQEALRKAEAEKSARLERERLDADRRRALDAIATIKGKADALRLGKDYERARQTYEEALKAIEASRFREEDAFSGYRRQIEQALGEDDIVYGAQGHVLYNGRWMTPEAVELARYGEGYVKYKGEFIHYTAMTGTIEKLCAPLVKKYIAEKYSGQTVHSKNTRFQKAVLTRTNADYAEFSVYYQWKVWTFKGVDEDLCIVDIRYDVGTDKWSLVKGCE